MPSFNVFQVAGSALSAQTTRLNTVASNLANADTVATTPEGTYKPRAPVFRVSNNELTGHNGVRVDRIEQDQRAPQARYQPGHPLANDEGYVYAPNVDVVEEMANMISASRSYQSNLEVMSSAKDLMMKTLNTGRT